MAGPLLYSTNPFIKLIVQEKYRGDFHYIWCSESFDSNKLPGYSIASLVASTSNPASIYKDLSQGCKKGEKHCSKIGEIRTSLKALAVDWHKKGEINDDDKEELILLADEKDPMFWRPLIYVMPRDIVKAKLKPVKLSARASFGSEFVIEDLKRTEFDIIEID